MRTTLLFISLLCFGCRTLDKKIIQESSIQDFQSQSVIQPQYPLIGTFQYDTSIAYWGLQESYNLKEWYDIPDEIITVLPDGSWLIDTKSETTSIYGNIHNKGRMFYRLVSK